VNSMADLIMGSIEGKGVMRDDRVLYTVP
jgi:hypothetical protein